jgi:hypothetical protein
MLRLVLKLTLKIVMSLFLLGSAVLAQQDTCPTIVQAALDATAEQCSVTGRNQACYGNVNLNATPKTGINDFTFSAPGDIVAVNSIDTLSLSSKVDTQGEWGVALMKLQANLPDTLPGQNVTFLLFGDVQLQNGVEGGDSSTGAPLTPMQAFYFQSGMNDAPCTQAPDSGILVQTPRGVEQIQFTVNDVNITLGSTVYLQAQAHGEMTASVVEGEATIQSDGLSVDVPAGSRVRVPLDVQGRALGVPSEPEPYDAAKMAVLPIRILPRAITTAAPLSAEDLAAVVESAATGNAKLVVVGNQADWVDSGIKVSAGQIFTVAAHGRMNPCLDDYPNGAEYCIFFAPQGSQYAVTQNNQYGVFPGLGLRFMALLGKIGNGKPFYVGAGGIFTASEAGKLWFTPNDNTRTDNRGTYRVLVWRAGG